MYNCLWHSLQLTGIFFFLLSAIRQLKASCEVGTVCSGCKHLTDPEITCSDNGRRERFIFCDDTLKVIRMDPRAFVVCDNGTRQSVLCADGLEFNVVTQHCDPPVEKVQRKRSNSGGSRTGDLCAFNTDCQSGMYCFNGACTCLSDYVAIAGYCWPKVNPGDSGCVEDLQCEAVWPGSKCIRGGLCECPEHTVPSKTRDGTVCVSSTVPPSCALPEPNSPGPMGFT